MILGTGIDLVAVDAFAEQVADAASAFVDGTFTAGERRDAGGKAERLAVRFAAKEAFVKAWSTARFGRTPQMDRADLSEVEVVTDGFGRPSLVLHGAVATAVAAELGDVRLHVSLSHDGPSAVAVVLVEEDPS